jgi:hypothetical protein
MKYGGWRTTVSGTQKVMWWKALSDVPNILILFLVHCMAHYDNAMQVMKLFDADGNGRISRSEFERATDEMGGKMFKDPDLSRQLFRFLDMDNGGDVCAAEWHALQELWNELELAILEFLQFLDRTFGGNFDMAWEELEADGAHESDWKQAVQRVGYFGHSSSIFSFAAEGEGRHAMMTRQSFEKLKAVWSHRAELLSKILSPKPDSSSRNSSQGRASESSAARA